MKKIVESEMLAVLKSFIKQMVDEGYDMDYIGRMCAILIHLWQKS